MEFQIGQIFTSTYPPEAAVWCNANNAYIEKTDDGYIIKKVPDLSFEELKANKLAEINSKYNEATSSLVSTYPSTELLTFDKQEKEARAWKENNEVSTPLIDNLALGRKLDKAELVDRIIKKADLFTNATGYLTGQRQYYEDLLDLCDTADDIKEINPIYEFPVSE